MIATRLKPFSTKLIRPPAPEFEQNFIEGGWPRVNAMYGKRCAYRWYVMTGPEKLKAARLRYRKGQTAGGAK